MTDDHWIASGAPTSREGTGELVLFGARLGLSAVSSGAGVTFRGVGESISGPLDSVAVVACGGVSGDGTATAPPLMDVSSHFQCSTSARAAFGTSMVLIRRDSPTAARLRPAEEGWQVTIAVGAPGVNDGQGAVLIMALEHTMNSSAIPFRLTAAG